MITFATLQHGWDSLESARPSSRELQVWEVEGADRGRKPPVLALDAQGLRHVLVPVPRAARIQSDTRSTTTTV